MKSFVRVLIVDDEDLFRSTLRGLISWEEEGFLLVGFAENGKQALSLLEATMPQIVITDIAMPVMDGIELIREIKRINAMPNWHEHPISSIVISGFETFSYVREAMKYGAFDYLLKSELNQKTLLQRLQNLVACMPTSFGEKKLEFSKFFSSLLNGLYTNIEFVQEQITRYGLSFHLDQPLLLAQSFCDEKNEDFVQAADARRLLLERLPACSCAVFLHGNCCIILGQSDDTKMICAAIKSIFEDCPSLYWGIFDKLSHILACKDAMNLLRQIPQQHFYQPNQKLFLYKEDLIYTIPEQIDPTLIEAAIHQSDYQRLMVALGDFLNKCSIQNASPYTVRKNCEHAIYILMFALEKAGEKTAGWNQKKIEYFQKVEKAVSIDELCDVLDDILSDITSWNAAAEESNTALLYQIDSYIEENYMKPIHLSDLSNHVHLSYHYLSRILKNSYAKSFNELLNHVRINASQHLLLSTNMTLSEVAEAVGFSDQSYWGKVFKKQTGLSPRMYRLKGRSE